MALIIDPWNAEENLPFRLQQQAVRCNVFGVLLENGDDAMCDPLDGLQKLFLLIISAVDISQDFLLRAQSLVDLRSHTQALPTCKLMLAHFACLEFLLFDARQELLETTVLPVLCLWQRGMNSMLLSFQHTFESRRV